MREAPTEAQPRQLVSTVEARRDSKANSGAHHRPPIGIPPVGLDRVPVNGVGRTSLKRLGYGSWVARLDAADVAGAVGRRFSSLGLAGGRLRWVESHPAEGGRSVVVEAAADGSWRDITPETLDVRTRVHEFGGGACWYHGETVFVSDLADGRVHRIDESGSSPLTPAAEGPQSLRYADGCVSPDGTLVYCVREHHLTGAVKNEIVAFRADSSAAPHIVASGHDFYAAPRVAPSGRWLSWLTWDHPRMPWDGTQLWLCELGKGGLPIEVPRAVAGGVEESIVQPDWSPDGALHFCSDRTGWWNLHRVERNEVRELTRLNDGEIGGPAWWLGLVRYVFCEGGRIVCAVTRAASDTLEILEPDTGVMKSLGLDWTAYSPYGGLAAAGTRVAYAAASPIEPTTIVELDLETGREQRIRSATSEILDRASISLPRRIEYPAEDGGRAHAFYYPPTSADFVGPPGERPPLRVVCHGGPTFHTAPQLDLPTQYFTQRGIAVVHVNYRGSSGFGRAYRRLLDGRWGVTDWRDCVAAATHLATIGEIDPARTWVEGFSAGGYIVLCAMAFAPRAFAAGVSYYGISDVAAFASRTHKLESRYCETLVGSTEDEALYKDRSPLHSAARIERPLLLFQGLDDTMVLPEQTASMVAALENSGVTHASLLFPDEGHGFTRLENISRAFEATLSFIGQVLGFEPAGPIETIRLAEESSASADRGTLDLEVGR